MLSNWRNPKRNLLAKENHGGKIVNSENATGISNLILIAGRKEKDKILSSLASHGAKAINTLYGRGSVKAGYITCIFGCVPEDSKVVITCIIKDTDVQGVFDMLENEFEFNSPNTGIAYTIKINGISL